MPVVQKFTFQTPPSPKGDAVLRQAPVPDSFGFALNSVLGIGLQTPVQRDGKTDFAHVTGGDFQDQKIGQVLGTRGADSVVQGEVPWRTEFGSSIDRLRHSNNNVLLEQTFRTFAVDSLGRFMPEVQVTNVIVDRDANPEVFFASVHYDLVDPVTGRVEASGLVASVRI